MITTPVLTSIETSLSHYSTSHKIKLESSFPVCTPKFFRSLESLRWHFYQCLSGDVRRSSSVGRKSHNIFSFFSSYLGGRRWNLIPCTITHEILSTSLKILKNFKIISTNGHLADWLYTWLWSARKPLQKFWNSLPQAQGFGVAFIEISSTGHLADKLST